MIPSPSNVFDTAGNRIGTVKNLAGAFAAFDATGAAIGGTFETAATAVHAVWNRWRYPPSVTDEDELAEQIMASWKDEAMGGNKPGGER